MWLDGYGMDGIGWYPGEVMCREPYGETKDITWQQYRRCDCLPPKALGNSLADTTGTQHLEKNKRQWNLDGSIKKETYDRPISGSDKAKKENMGEEEEQHHDSSDTAIASFKRISQASSR